MPISTGKKFQSASSSGISAQQQVLELFLDAIRRVEDILVEDYTEKDREEKRWQAFQLQMMCLRKLVPDRAVQQRVKEAINKKQKEYKEEKTFSSERQADYVAHMEVFTEVMLYLNEGMDLIHHDIVGAMTSRAAEGAKLPDLQPKIIHPEEHEQEQLPA
ncbi:MAG: hypothetical protein M0Q91_05190 [Methanoregula sp.]|jgi:hypothetical protein|nr:hypothetical protein [Methanoregula sp.]